MKKPNNAHLARIYGTTERQLARWRSAKAPLFDVTAMMAFFASRASAPAHITALSVEEREAMQAELNALRKVSPLKPKRVRPAGDRLAPLQGAQHALRRLEQEETKLYRQMEDAEGNAFLEAAIRKQWRETLLSLKQYDVLVEAGRRDTGEVLTRAQLLPVLTTLAVWLRRGNEDFLNSICLQIAEAATPEAVYSVIAPSIRQSVGNAVNAATNDGKLPGWVREALVSGL